MSDEEGSFSAPLLTLMKEYAPQRNHSLREVFNAPGWFVRAGCPWRMMPHDLPPWAVGYQQTQRWVKGGISEAMTRDLRVVLRLGQDRNEEPRAVILDGRTLQSTTESGGRTGFAGHNKRKGSKVHAAVATLGRLLALRVPPANEQDRAQVAELAQAVQSVTGENVEIAFVDQGNTGQAPAGAAVQAGIHLEVINHHEAKHGFVLLPRRRVVEQSFGWAARFRRLARDYERLAGTLAGHYWLAFALLMLTSGFRRT